MIRRFALRPRSLNGLILLGFVAVASPLLLGTINAAVEMRDLSVASERLVTDGVAATQYTQAIVRQVASLERTARLYQILRRPGLLDTFGQNHELLAGTLAGLERLPGDPDRATVIDSIRRTADSIESGLASPEPRVLSEALRQFTSLARDAGRLSTLASQQTDRELRELRAATERTRLRILWQSAALVPVTISLMLAFTLFVGRPIRQLDRAIDAIGHGRINEPVTVKGPADLQALGRQLEWLRVRLGEIEDERNRFLRHMSHELKTPLANLREGNELLLEGAVGPLGEGQREVASIMRDNSVRLQRLIENLLSYSEWQAKRGGLELTEMRLPVLVTAAVEPYRLPIAARHLQLVQEVDDVSFRGDLAKLRLVFDNLVSNAVKFSRDGGTIVVRGRRDGNDVLVEVADSGPGIPVAERERIFEAFYQGTTPHGGLLRGTGIGLSVVQEFVLAHGGRIELVDGEFPGAHFRVRLPALSGNAS